LFFLLYMKRMRIIIGWRTKMIISLAVSTQELTHSDILFIRANTVFRLSVLGALLCNLSMKTVGISGHWYSFLWNYINTTWSRLIEDNLVEMGSAWLCGHAIRLGMRGFGVRIPESPVQGSNPGGSRQPLTPGC